MLRYVQELKEIIILNGIGYGLRVDFLLDGGKGVLHIAGQSDTFVTQCSYLPSKFTDRKPGLDGEHFVIHTFDWIVYLYQFRKVGERN